MEPLTAVTTMMNAEKEGKRVKTVWRESLVSLSLLPLCLQAWCFTHFDCRLFMGWFRRNNSRLSCSRHDEGFMLRSLMSRWQCPNKRPHKQWTTTGDIKSLWKKIEMRGGSTCSLLAYVVVVLKLMTAFDDCQTSHVFLSRELSHLFRVNQCPRKTEEFWSSSRWLLHLLQLHLKWKKQTLPLTSSTWVFDWIVHQIIIED